MNSTTAPKAKDKCPCGSGRKYKRCCGLLQSVSSLERAEEAYEVARGAEYEFYELVQESVDYAPEQILALAEDAFGLEGVRGDEGFESPGYYMFRTWLFFHFPWSQTPAGQILTLADSVRNQLKPVLKKISPDSPPVVAAMPKFIEAALRAPFLWYMIEEIVPGKRMLLRDFFSDRTIEVLERTASRAELKGCYILTKVVEMPLVRLMLGCCPLIIQPTAAHRLIEASKLIDEYMQEAIAEFSDEMPLSEELAYDMALRNIFVEIAVADTEVRSRRPQLRNFDGDDFEAFVLTFDLRPNSRSAVLERLKSLPPDTISLGEDEDVHDEEKIVTCSLQKSIHKGDHAGELVSVAALTLDGDTLHAEVNSVNRREFVRKKLRKLLGDLVLSTSSASHELAELPVPQPKDIIRDPEIQKDIQARLQEMQAQHWEKWFDTPVPALKNMTPNEAAKSVEGREMLHALLHYYEQMDSRKHPAAEDFGVNMAADIGMLRRRLGLD